MFSDKTAILYISYPQMKTVPKEVKASSFNVGLEIPIDSSSTPVFPFHTPSMLEKEILFI